jgi:hypothetical protein
MQLSADTKIAGWKTVNDWNAHKILLADFSDKDAWTTAYTDYFLTRLQDRYLDPLKAIKENGTYRGEGFSIMAIICSLVEFLESTYQGINYRYRTKADPPLGQFEYGGSADIFTSFLTQRSPFDKSFNKTTAENFYRYVRCGLLHEARTKGKWTIWGTTSAEILIEDKKTEVIVYRDNFLNATNTFIEEYKTDLLNSNDRKEAFVRKYDNLCSE